MKYRAGPDVAVVITYAQRRAVLLRVLVRGTTASEFQRLRIFQLVGVSSDKQKINLDAIGVTRHTPQSAWSFILVLPFAWKSFGCPTC